MVQKSSTSTLFNVLTTHAVRAPNQFRGRELEYIENRFNFIGFEGCSSPQLWSVTQPYWQCMATSGLVKSKSGSIYIVGYGMLIKPMTKTIYQGLCGIMVLLAA